MKKRKGLFIITSILITIVIFSIVSWVIVNKKISKIDSYPKEVHLYNQFTKEQNSNYQSFELNNNFKYHIFKNKSSNKIIVVTHGLGDGKERNIELIKYLYSLGYNVLTYDLRSNNENKSITPTSMGYNESKDLKELITSIPEKYKIIDLYGVSMGGVTTIKYLEDNLHNKINKVLVDAPFVNAWKQINHEAKSSIPTGFNFGLQYLINWINYSLKGFDFRDIDILENINTIKNKVQIISPNNDDRILKNMNYDLLKSKSKIDNISFQTYISNKHAQGMNKSSQVEYKKIIKHFFDK